ncbi:AraC family transcriptional regulator [Afipia massiliensis]|uniref:AraC family transcriptional regulator n=1 Tax=Afipia massiliensis TaxID=211460 RepID=A0A4U6BRI8_9BRAD|nr:AraC family transcriptional regulator [Afipia massiliensis]TKT71648.1 AraC family transcriptional regulator [Afipia massiliensis]
MTAFHLIRCQFLIPFADVCDEIGAPTEALLSKLRLPVSLEEKANHYIPILLAVRFAETAQRSQGITDIGFQAARRLQFCHLSERLRTAIRFSPTLFVALQQLCKWASFEDTALGAWLERDDNRVRICTKLAGTSNVPHPEHSHWLQNVMSMHVVRQFAGPDWVPATMAFEGRYEPSPETRSVWGNTRFMSNQSASWIDVPVSMLDLPNLASETPASHDDEAGPDGHEIVSAIKLMLPSYLDDKIPTVAEIAEMAGISIRSFQRKLSNAGVSYSDLLDRVRFENASKLLRGTDAKIIDVAFSSGYTDPAHFTRAFRRFTGVTPREFRGKWKSQLVTPQ